MFNKDLIRTFSLEDLEGKMLEMHYGYDNGHYCLIGLDKENDIRYVLVVK